MKQNRPSGAQQRKKQKGKALHLQSLAGSLLKFVTSSNSGLTSSDPEESNFRGDGRENTETISQSKGQDELDFEENRVLCDSDSSFESEEQTQMKTDNQERQATGLLIKEYRESEEDKLEGDDKSEGKQISSNILYNDISDWPFPVPDSLRVDLIKRGSEAYQNKDGPFGTVTRSGDKIKGSICQLTSDWFYISLPNSEKILRTWMVYSTKKQSLYCFCCRLFGTDKNLRGNPSKFMTGFQSWWKLHPKVQSHENSEQHLTCFEKWKTLRASLISNKMIDQVSQTVAETEKRKWRDILKRLLDVTLFLAQQNLPFRGHREHRCV